MLLAEKSFPSRYESAPEPPAAAGNTHMGSLLGFSSHPSSTGWFPSTGPDLQTKEITANHSESVTPQTQTTIALQWSFLSQATPVLQKILLISTQ